MIAEVLKEEFYSFDEMAMILSVKPTTLKHRIYTGSKHPPFVREAGVYLFPKDSFLQWMRTKPRVAEVKGA
jgi:hypothetical protein